MSIYRDKRTGQWRYEFDRWIDGQRVRHRKLLPPGTTRAQAEAYDRAQSAALFAVASGSARPRHRIDDAVACYLRERVPALKSGPIIRRELAWLADWTAGRWIDELPKVCAEYDADQRGALAPATVRNRIAYLRAACRWSWKRHNMADADPGARVHVPTVRNARDTTVDRRQMLAIARACPHRGVRAAIRCLWYSGMRLGELRAAQRGPEAFLLADTKNGHPRVVPIHPRIRAAALVPVPARGTIEHHWSRARAAAGLAHVRIHDLRHSAATEMVRAGVPLSAIGAVLGHLSHASTLRYAHHDVEVQRAAVAQIGRRRA
jgi:integrase